MLVTIGTAYHMLAHGSIQGVISKTVEMLEKTKSPPVVVRKIRMVPTRQNENTDNLHSIVTS